MQLDLRELLHFAVIAEEGSITAASRRLSIAQPWLSQRLKALEQRLGIALVVRQARGIALTPEGDRIHAISRQLVSIERRVLDEAREINTSLSSRIKVGAPPYSRRVSDIGQILSKLGADLPALTIETDMGWSPHLVARVQQGDLDAAFVSDPIEVDGLDTSAVTTLQRYLVFEKHDPLYGSAPIRPEELDGRMVEVFPQGVNGRLFERTFGHLRDSGVELVPTGFDGMPLKPATGSGAVIPSVFSTVLHKRKAGYRPLAGAQRTELRMVSRSGDDRQALRHLRRVAGRYEARVAAR